MPILANQRHERFAQLLVQGLTADAAYEAAGYKRNDGNASRLNGNDKVRERVAELQAEVAEAAVVSVAGITARLLAIASVGEREATAPMLSVARASLMDAAKLNGLVVDQSKADDTLKVVIQDEWAK